MSRHRGAKHRRRYELLGGIGGWDRDPQGYYMGGNNMALSPRALLKIGSMVMNGGTYNGQQIVPRAWLD